MPPALIVEDDVTNRTALARLLRMMGHEVETAATVLEGLAKLDWRPGYVILDLMLPDGCGVAVLKQIREAGLPIKVAVSSATYDPELMAQVAGLSPDLLLPKPVAVPLLVEWLEQAA